MDRLGKVAARSALGVGMLALIAGCTVKSTKVFEGSPASESQPWLSGDELYIQSPNGAVVVDTVSADDVSATVTPFVLLAHDATDEEARDELEKLELLVGWEEPKDGLTRITVNIERVGKVNSSLGGDLDVDIPRKFDGNLRIEHDNGQTEIRNPGSAKYVGVKSDNGSCDINAGGAAEIVVNCRNGHLDASVSSVPEDFSSASFSTGNGDIQVSFPGSGVFNVTGYSEGGGTVDTGNAQSAGCSVQVASESSKTVSCGGATETDPTYRVEASGQLAHDISLSF